MPRSAFISFFHNLVHSSDLFYDELKISDSQQLLGLFFYMSLNLVNVSAFQATFSKHQTQTSSLCVKNFSMNHIKQEFRLADMEAEKKLVRNKILEVSSWKKNRLSGENFLSKVQFRRNPSKNPSESFRRNSGQSDSGQQKA